NKKSSEVDKRIVRPNGEVRALHSQATAILDDSGKIVRLVGTSQDVTEAKAGGQALREAEEKYRSIFEKSSEGIFQNTAEGRALYYEGSVHEITDRKRAEAERNVISEIVQGVITTSNLGELLELARRSISKVLYAENCFVALHDPDTDLLDFKLWVDKVD